VTTRRTPPAADDRDPLVDALAQSAFLVMGVLTRLAAEHDLSLTQLRVLAILRGRRLRMTELADHLGLEKSTLSGLVDRAEQRGLVARTPSASDGRVIEVSLTTLGGVLAASGATRVREQLGETVARLTDAEQRRLESLLTKLLA
jgi:DNA-binding MarR family transcriptional regulator